MDEGIIIGYTFLYTNTLFYLILLNREKKLKKKKIFSRAHWSHLFTNWIFTRNKWHLPNYLLHQLLSCRSEYLYYVLYACWSIQQSLERWNKAEKIDLFMKKNSKRWTKFFIKCYKFHITINIIINYVFIDFILTFIRINTKRRKIYKKYVTLNLNSIYLSIYRYTQVKGKKIYIFKRKKNISWYHYVICRIMCDAFNSLRAKSSLAHDKVTFFSNLLLSVSSLRFKGIKGSRQPQECVSSSNQ